MAHRAYDTQKHRAVVSPRGYFLSRKAVRALLVAGATGVASAANATVFVYANAGSRIGAIPTETAFGGSSTAISAVARNYQVHNGLDNRSDAFAYGNARTGKMGASASSNGPGTASGRVDIEESLEFDIVGADTNTLTPISLALKIDGNMWSSADYSSAAYMSYGLVISQRVNGHHIGGASYALYLEQNAAYGGYISGGLDGWASYSVTGAGHNRNVALTFNLIGTNPFLEISTSLIAYSSGEAFSDYSHTASINLLVPNNVTWTSSSRAFLTDGLAVPEPATWAMMIVGLGFVGGAMRHTGRRRNERLSL